MAAACGLLACCTQGAGPRDIEVATDPPGAACDLLQGGTVVATVKPTPGTAHVESTYQDITFVCRHEGFREARYVRQWSPGSVLVGGAEGRTVDKWLGFAYDRPVHISMTPAKP
ncbi:MAG TPA: hypothetical protein VFA12_02320 [Stellaceae bacterium]|nr:hypothetical protein [Stellaceae bacterium]